MTICTKNKNKKEVSDYSTSFIICHDTRDNFYDDLDVPKCSYIVFFQVHLTGESTDRVYETLNLGSPVLKDIELTEREGEEDLTVLTEEKVN